MLPEPEPLVEVLPYLSIDPGAHVYPASQLVQLAEPAVEYFPAGHILEADPEPLVEVLPYWSIDASGHIYPASQFVHVLVVAPSAAEYFPATHFMNVAEVVAPVVLEYVPAGQFVHVAILVAPLVLENVPAGQFMHDVAPSPEYCPEPQMLDADPGPLIDVLPY